MTTGDDQVLEWAVAQQALPGQAESGDAYLVHPCAGGVLLGVVDGLGHGSEAAAAARLAVATIAAHADEPLIRLLRDCHEALKDTRGVVLSLAKVNPAERTMTWIGVGNVEGLLLRADPASRPPYEFILTRAGVVGYQLPQPHAEILSLGPGDLLLLATDGLQGDFGQALNRTRAPQAMADSILTRCRKGTDDALILVARYRGGTE